MNKTWPLLVVLVVGTGIIIAARTPAGERRMQEWLIGVPRGEEDGAAFTFSATIDPTGERPVLRTGDGRRIELRWEDGEGPMAAKTQVADHFGVSATLRFLCSSTAHPPGAMVHNRAAMDFGLGSLIGVGIEAYPEWHDGRLMMRIGSYDPDFPFGGLYELDDAFHNFVVTLSGDATVVSEVSEHPIGDKEGVTHAKEMKGKDYWVVAEGQTASATVVTEQGTYSRNIVVSETSGPGSTSLYVAFHCEGHYSHDTGDYLRMENISYTEVGIDASRLDEELEPTWAGGSWTGVKMRMIGAGSTIGMYSPGLIESADFDWSGTIQAPREYSFSGLHVRDMDGSDLSDLVICCPAVQVYDAASSSWQTVCQTLSEWQAADYKQDYGVYSWDATPPPDGARRLLPDVAFYIDRASARSHKLEGF